MKSLNIFTTALIFGVWTLGATPAHAYRCMDGTQRAGNAPCPHQYSVEIQCESRTKNPAGIVDFGNITIGEEFSLLDSQRQMFLRSDGNDIGSPTYLGAGYRSALWSFDSMDYLNGEIQLGLAGTGISGVPGTVVKDAEGTFVAFRGAVNFRFQASSEVAGSAFGRVGRVFRFQAKGSARVTAKRDLICRKGKDCFDAKRGAKVLTLPVRSEGVCVVSQQRDPVAASARGR